MEQSQAKNLLEQTWPHHRSGGIFLCISEAVFPEASVISQSKHHIAVKAVDEKKRAIFIVAIYAPAGDDAENNAFFSNDITATITGPCAADTPVILLGDFNAHVSLTGDRENPRRETKTELSVMASRFRLIDVARIGNGRPEMTHEAAHGKSRLDYVLVNRAFVDRFEQGIAYRVHDRDAAWQGP